MIRSTQWGNWGIDYLKDGIPVYRLEFPVGPQGPVDGAIGSIERLKYLSTVPQWVDLGIIPDKATYVRIPGVFREAPLRLYIGVRNSSGKNILVNGQPLKHIVRHSPTGMEWGYGGSGPADLAYSILVDWFHFKYPALKGKDLLARAELYHQDFKWAFVSRFPYAGWEILDSEIEAWMQETNIRLKEAADA